MPDRHRVLALGRPPIAAVVAMAMVAAVAAVGPALWPETGDWPARGTDQVLRKVAFDPPSYRLGYSSLDRQTLVAATPGQAGGSALGSAGGDADLDADARGDSLVWVSRRAPGNGVAGNAHLDGDLFLRRQSGPVVRLTNDSAVDKRPALSPDGKRVAFVSDRGGNDEIWVLDVAGGAPRRLTDHPAIDSWPTWSPDGTRLAFSSTRDDPAGDIYVMPAAGGQPTRLTDDPAADTEPAWSPDGQRLAFTTTRFRASSAVPAGSVPLTDVVTMPVAGGELTRPVPTTIDSAQPAWASDSRRLAFVSLAADSFGDVYVVDGGVATAVAAEPSRGEYEPTWRGSQVVYTSTAVSDESDVWSAAAVGGERRDDSARPWANERGPAYTADGTRLAYSVDDPASGGERIVVADADGRNARMITPRGTDAGDRDSDPVWSPDGTMIAFSRYHPRGDSEGGTTGDREWLPNVDGEPGSRVLVARVSDGTLVGELPVPEYLNGDDEQPAWSPDGKRIALARMATDRITRVDPVRTDRPLRPDEAFTQDVSVRTDAEELRPEIVFLLDTTSSTTIERLLLTYRDTIRDIVKEVQRQQPNARFALAEFGAQPKVVLGWELPNHYYRRLSDLIGGSDAGSRLGKEVPLLPQSTGKEGWYNALLQAFSGGESERVHLRPHSSPIAVVIGDGHNQDDTVRPKISGKSKVTRQQVIDLLDSEEIGARFIGVPASGLGEKGLDKGGHATAIAAATGGMLAKNSDANTVSQAILKTITNYRVTVKPNVERCDKGLNVTFDPATKRTITGQKASFDERIELSASAEPGSVLTCEIAFDIKQAAPADELKQWLTVRVSHRDRPFVRVDDVTVRATGPEGAKVDYTATAVSSSDVPLPKPVCTPRPGSVFPVGQTTVTCTSSAGLGAAGKDIATITVIDPTGISHDARGRRIWVTELKVASGKVTFGNQRDLSARVSQTCRTRGTQRRGASESGTGEDPGDHAPAWSPGGERLAFTDSYDGENHEPGLCVVDPDGTHPRTPVRDADAVGGAVSDPAWSPDGTSIAYVQERTEAPPAIFTVPSTGGQATRAIASVGGARQPAYRALPGRDLNVTATVAGQPAYVGGDPIPVTFTVQNTSPRTAVNLYLSPTIPAALTKPTQVDSRCDAAGTVCRLGDLPVTGQTTVTIMLPARTAISGTIAIRATATVGDRAPVHRKASVPVTVLQPAMKIDPEIGPPGFVARAIGSNFPPGAVVRLTWESGLTAAPDTVTVLPDGTIDAQQLIMRKDRLGKRKLRAEWVSGTRFGTITAGNEFLVVRRQLDPPIFDGRG